MPITIDGDGTITGVSVGGLPDGIVDADMIASNAVTTAKISDSQITEAKLASDPQQGIAKAWINFDGGASTIGTGRDSFNVDSVTDNGPGDYTVNFTNAMASANYAVAISCKANGGSSAIPIPHYNIANAMTTTSMTFHLSEANSYGTKRDSAIVCFIAFGD